MAAALDGGPPLQLGKPADLVGVPAGAAQRPELDDGLEVMGVADQPPDPVTGGPMPHPQLDLIVEDGLPLVIGGGVEAEDEFDAAGHRRSVSRGRSAAPGSRRRARARTPHGRARARRGPRSRSRREVEHRPERRQRPAPRARACPTPGARRGGAVGGRRRTPAPPARGATAASRCGRDRRTAPPARRAGCCPARSASSSASGMSSRQNRSDSRTAASAGEAPTNVSTPRTWSGLRITAIVGRQLVDPRPECLVRLSGGAIGSSTATSPRDSTSVDVTVSGQSSPSRQSGCAVRQIRRPGATSSKDAGTAAS